MGKLKVGLCCLFWGMGLLNSAFAQIEPDTLETNEGAINQELEDLIGAQEVDEQVDYTYLTDYLEDLRRKPLDLNLCSREETGIAARYECLFGWEPHLAQNRIWRFCQHL